MADKTLKSKKPKRKKIRDPFVPGFWKGHWREALILTILSVGLYIQTIPYDFVLDDVIVITENNFTKKGLEGVAEIFSSDSFTGYFGEQKEIVAGARYRPLSIALFAVVYEYFGLDARYYHGLNILLYTLLVLLVFRCLSAVFAQVKASSGWLTAIPFVAATLYALHPVHTEAVANIKGCDEILAMLFSMASLYASLKIAYKHRPLLWMVLSAFLFFIGLMSKENTITFLAIIPLTLYFFTKSSTRTIVLSVLPAVVATAVYLFVRISAVGFLFGDTVSTDLLNDPFVEMTTDERWATVMYTLGQYLRLLVFPHPLTHDYYPYHVPIMHWVDWQVILSVAAYLLLGVIAVMGLRKRTIASYCTIFFVATLSIVANIVFPIGTFMNERFLFMPSLAFCIALPYYVSRVPFKPKILYPTIIALYVVLFSVRAYTRVPAWESPLSLNTAGVSVSKNSCRANCFMGTAIYKEALDISDRQERYDRMLLAEEYLDKSLAIYPKYYSANQMKSGIVAEHYRMDRDLDRLLSGFETVLLQRPNIPYIPKYCEYLNGRGNIDVRKMSDWYYRVSVDILLGVHRRADFAKIYIGYGLALDPQNAMLNLGAARIYQAAGEQDKAQIYRTRAYGLDPSLQGK